MTPQRPNLFLSSNILHENVLHNIIELIFLSFSQAILSCLILSYLFRLGLAYPDVEFHFLKLHRFNIKSNGGNSAYNLI